MVRKLLLGMLPATALIATAAVAHHSTAMFEWGKEVTIPVAVVQRWDWTNPHTFLYVEVPNKTGGKDVWAFEGMSPNHLGRIGWSKRTLKAGDRIALSYYPLKDGRKGGFDVSVTLPGGPTMRQLSRPGESPANDK